MSEILEHIRAVYAARREAAAAERAKALEADAVRRREAAEAKAERLRTIDAFAMSKSEFASEFQRRFRIWPPG